MERYERDIIISKLKAKGLKPKPNERNIEYWEQSANNCYVGIKSLGQADSLGTPIRKLPRRERKSGEVRKRFVPRFRSSFSGKMCCICRKQATTQRDYEDKCSYICDSGKCERLWRDRNGITEPKEW